MQLSCYSCHVIACLGIYFGLEGGWPDYVLCFFLLSKLPLDAYLRKKGLEFMALAYMGMSKLTM